MGSVLSLHQTKKEPATVVVEELAPAADAWQMCRRLAGLPHVLFFDSAGHYPGQGRYSFLTSYPFAWLQARGRAWKTTGFNPGARQADAFVVLSEHLAR